MGDLSGGALAAAVQWYFATKNARRDQPAPSEVCALIHLQKQSLNGFWGGVRVQLTALIPEKV